MSNKIVKIKKPEDVKLQESAAIKEVLGDDIKLDDIEMDAIVASNTKDVLEKLSNDVVSYCSSLMMIKESKKKIIDFLGNRCELSVRVYGVNIDHAPHIKRHASMGIIPTIGNDEYAELLFPGVIDELGKNGVKIEQSPVVMDTIITLRGLISNVANLIIQTITLRNPDIYKKCFEISVMPDKTTEAEDGSGIDAEPEWSYCRESEVEILKMVESVMSKEDVLYLIDNYLF